ncbi:MAG: homoserine O-succinyltransferase, partial [Paramuribaculum sp.]|nr:homoserine O-succinyltransferase [Paramuribaculum sp.]
MTITAPKRLPSAESLTNSGFTNISTGVPASDALRILILNLMPKKAETEADIMRMLSASPVDLDITFAVPDQYKSKNTPQEYISKYYRTLSSVMQQTWHGMIVTGAPLDFVEYENVYYWHQICELMHWSRTHVRSTMWVCWGAFAALYHRYGIQKHTIPSKLSGVFRHTILHPEHPLMENMTNNIHVPHSRHVITHTNQILAQPRLMILTYSPEAGAYIIAERNSRDIMIFGHPEYNATTLHNEYIRDLGKGINPHIPDHY